MILADRHCIPSRVWSERRGIRALFCPGEHDIKTLTGSLLIPTPPATGGGFASLIVAQRGVRMTIELTREEAAELGRQLVTVAHGRRMILTQDGPAVLA